jgi:hypothetical protein
MKGTSNTRNVPGGPSLSEWFNRNCFSQPAFGTWGNSGEGVYTNPGLNNWNISLRKSFRTRFFPESGRLDFIGELFNAFNHTQLGPATNTTTVVSGARSGTITSTRPPRQIQLSLKYMF